jgi:hypothetical protein
MNYSKDRKYQKRFYYILKSTTLRQIKRSGEMKNFNIKDIPGLQTRVVIKRIPGRINGEDHIQLDLPLALETRKRV